MATRPILMSGPMVRAILDGRKTQTRRVVKPQPKPATAHPECSPWVGKLTELDYAVTWCTPKAYVGIYKDRDEHSPFRCPYGQPGDLLWVRETWRVAACCDGQSPRALNLTPRHVEYSTFRFLTTPQVGRWRPSIHMPRWASRLTLRITDVRLEQVQEITREDADAEGVSSEWASVPGSGMVRGFEALWDSINAKRAPWDSNPWVWVIEFEVIRANVDAILRECTA